MSGSSGIGEGRRQAGLEAVFRAIVTHPVAVSMVFAAAVVFGWVSYASLPIELMPDISYPTITVRTTWDGAAPEEVESQVSRPVEEALATLDGLVRLESRSRAGGSDVVLGFDWGTDMDASTQAIRENLQLTFFPDGVERPLILRYDPSLEPFLRLAVAVDSDATGDPQQRLLLLRDLADRVVRRDLEGMEGVAAVKVKGGLEREVRVDVRQDWLEARHVRLEQVRQALAAQNVNVAGGSIVEGDVEYLVRTLDEYKDADDIRSVRVPRDDGETVPLSDLATVTEASKERDVVTHLDGREAVELEIYKEADANVVDVSRRVQAKLFGSGAESATSGDRDVPVAERLPKGAVLKVLDDQATFIDEAIANLRDAAVIGGLLSVAILFLFLRDFRATAIIGLAIPLSVVIGMGPLYLDHVSLNLMSLGGLALGVGMLVDNAVVVLESIQVGIDAGLPRQEAVVRGTATVAAAVTASTLTAVAVFVPIAFVEGIAGQLFADLSMAVVSSLVASLAVALGVVPMLAALELPEAGDVTALDGTIGVLARWWKGVPADPSEAGVGVVRALLREQVDGPRARFAADRGSLKGVRRLLFPYLLGRFLVAIGFRLAFLPVLIGATVAVALAWRIVGFVVRPVAWSLMAVANGFHAVYGPFSRAYVRVLGWSIRRPLPVAGLAFGTFALALLAVPWLGSELIPAVHQGKFVVEAALPIGTPLQRTVEVMSDVERVVRQEPGVDAVYTTIGVDRTADAAADEGEHTARIRVALKPGATVDDEERAMDAVRRDLAAFGKLDVRLTRPSLFSVEDPVEVVVHGWDLATLRQAGDAASAALSAVPGLRDVHSSLVRGYPEVRIRYDRERLARFGLDPSTVATRVRDGVAGVEATSIRKGDELVDLRVRLAEDDRGTLADLQRMNVNPALNPPIPLEAVADLDQAEGPSEIRRVDQQRAVVVSGTLEGFDLGRASGGIEGALDGVDWPADVTWSVAGQSVEMQRSTDSLLFALGLAMFLVYAIMAATFESLVHPFVILFSVPVALIGVVTGLGVAGVPVSVVVFLGVIVLAGVVVNHAIVLVDAVNRLRDEGREPTDALLAAGALRLRPILITAATCVLGLVPLALGIGAGAEVQRPLAITVIGGMTSSTFLTLVVVPIVYALVTGVYVRRPVAAAPEPEPAK